MRANRGPAHYCTVRIERDVDEVVGRPMEVCFTEQIDLGICDLPIITPDGQVIVCPMRVVRDGTGSEVMFSLPADAVADP